MPGLVAVCFVAVTLPSTTAAQAIIRGSVSSTDGEPIAGATVSIEPLGIAALASTGGRYALTVPDEGLPLQVTVTARQLGYATGEASVTLEPGGVAELDFALDLDPFELDAIVVTGQGLEAERRVIGSTINSVRLEDVRRSLEPNVIQALAGKAPNVEVTSSTGDPGGGSYIRIRGTRSLVAGTQPLIVVDGTPIINESHPHDSFDADNPIDGTAYLNRAADLNPADIESIEILKGAAASSIYGSRASNGVVLISTRSGAPNATRWTLNTSLGFDRVTQLPGLQTRYGEGPAFTSWGPALEDSVPVFDHARELFGTGSRTDNALVLEGGTERATYYASLGHAYQDGVVRGNSSFGRTTARLKASYELRSDLLLTGSFGYTATSGDLVQQGSNLSGLLVAGLRTPPEFNNCLPEADPCYTDPLTGLHRSYRLPNPTSDSQWRGYDNPFWVANEITNTTDANRTLGNLSIAYEPAGWLRLQYLIGVDFAHDRRVSVHPRSSSNFEFGRVHRREFVDDVFDQSLLATLDHRLSRSLSLSWTLGHNLNRTGFKRLGVDAFDLVAGATQVEFARLQFAEEFEATVRTEGYFAEATLGYRDELYLRGGLRADAANTFGGDVGPDGRAEAGRFWYPTASVAWDFSSRLDVLDFGKLRLAYGVAGVQPPPFSNLTGFEPFGAGTLQGFQMLARPSLLGNPDIEPERTRELEVGIDLAFARDRLAVGLTRYWQKTTNAILRVGLPPETGFEEAYRNGAQWRNWGWEATLDAIALRRPEATWAIGLQWSQNRSMVDELLGSERVFLDGFSSATHSGVVQGHPLPVLIGSDFVRFGRGTVVGGVDIDQAYSGWRTGDLYVNAGGFPEVDPTARVIGDPNPDWTGSVRNTVTLFDRLTVSVLVDVKWGGEMWNGTKGYLTYFGTHEESERFHGAGVDTVFVGVGPGAGTPVNLNLATWNVFGPVGVGGASSPYIEDAGFIKLRDISVSMRWEGGWVGRLGLGSVDATLSGRNLFTWTDYTGIDPESNLTGQTAGRGLEYFNNPQTRTFMFLLSLRR